MSGRLLAAKVEQIQTYLLSTPRLRLIRGGSSRLVELDQEFRTAVTTRGGTVGCAGGGIYLALFDDGADKACRDAAADLRGNAARLVPAARLRVAVGPRDGSVGLGPAVRDVMERGIDMAAPPSPPPELPFARPCDLCRARPAQFRRAVGDGVARCCADCTSRLKATAQGQHLDELQKELDRLGVWPRDDERRPVVDDLAQDKPHNYIAYLAADGNAVGRALDALATEAEYRDFSDGLARATKAALVGGIKALKATAPPGKNRRPKVLPVIAGGDDLLAYTSPSFGVPLAVEFAKGFEDQTASLPKGSLTIAVGVVVAHASTPFAALDEAAHRLQRHAKRHHRLTGGSAVAFAAIHQGTGAEPETLAAGEYPEPRVLGNRYYSLADAETLIVAARQIAAGDTPRTKLKQIDSVLRRHDTTAESDWQLLLDSPSVASIRPQLERAAVLPSGSRCVAGHTPWRWAGKEIVTALPDLVALAEFQ